MNQPRLIDATALLNYISNLQKEDTYEDYYEYYEMMKDIIKEFPAFKNTNTKKGKHIQ